MIKALKIWLSNFAGKVGLEPLPFKPHKGYLMVLGSMDLRYLGLIKTRHYKVFSYIKICYREPHF